MSRAILVVISLYLLIVGPIAALVCWDARKSELESPLQWAAFVFVFNGIGLILYLSEKDTQLHDEADATPYSLPGKKKNGHDDQQRE
ncbi:hypothetical protein [Halopiger goleimassiliensis]|uniref:hypothetical protein n=1 Tax=Halopiger goleimassiliensis TaxID=1293048 RepID=UPI0012B56EF5|nr:hypothetical protein [Halopiger goleimassiliensis]